MKSKIKFLGFIAVPVILFLLSIGCLAFGDENNKFVSYFTVPFGSILTFGTALLVAYFFTQQRTDERKRVEIFCEYLHEIEDLLSDDRFIIKSNDDYNYIRIKQRTVKNRLDLLDKNKDFLSRYKIEDKVKYMYERFNDYWELVSVHAGEIDRLRSHENELMNILECVIDRSKDIKFRIHFN